MSKSILFEFYRDESGATAIEYALLTVFIAIGLIVSMSSLGNSLSNSYTNTGNAFPK
ncbi:MAG: Flp family type IVb pilin [Pseudomonadota bacterium]